MKRHEILSGRSYLNVSGRNERHVLEVGRDVNFDWYGATETRPAEPGVRFILTRTGKTFYGRRSEQRPATMALSAFAKWAHQMVDEGSEAPR